MNDLEATSEEIEPALKLAGILPPEAGPTADQASAPSDPLSVDFCECIFPLAGFSKSFES